MTNGSWKKENISLKICGTGTVGPKWQIVVPKEIRTIMNIAPGDNVIFLLKDNKFAGFVKNTDFVDIIEYAKAEGITIA